jgi:hypothetical protein
MRQLTLATHKLTDAAEQPAFFVPAPILAASASARDGTAHRLCSFRNSGATCDSEINANPKHDRTRLGMAGGVGVEKALPFQPLNPMPKSSQR